MYLGDFKTSSTVTFPFTTHDSSGNPIAPLSAFEAGDLVIYKNSSGTQRSSSAGVTMTSPFDSVTGLHMISIDTSDNTDSGFYAAGNDYHVLLIPDSETVDGRTVVSRLFSFSIENRCLNWAMVASPTTTVGLTNTTVKLTSDGIDNVAIESGVNARQGLAIIAAASAGKVSGASGTNIILKGLNNTTTRIDATVDADGNRSAVTLTLPS